MLYDVCEESLHALQPRVSSEDFCEPVLEADFGMQECRDPLDVHAVERLDDPHELIHVFLRHRPRRCSDASAGRANHTGGRVPLTDTDLAARSGKIRRVSPKPFDR